MLACLTDMGHRQVEFSGWVAIHPLNIELLEIDIYLFKSDLVKIFEILLNSTKDILRSPMLDNFGMRVCHPCFLEAKVRLIVSPVCSFILYLSCSNFLF